MEQNFLTELRTCETQIAKVQQIQVHFFKIYLIRTLFQIFFTKKFNLLVIDLVLKLKYFKLFLIHLTIQNAKHNPVLLLWWTSRMLRIKSKHLCFGFIFRCARHVRWHLFINFEKILLRTSSEILPHCHRSFKNICSLYNTN